MTTRQEKKLWKIEFVLMILAVAVAFVVWAFRQISG
jgi:cytochrome c-type biogenesis protein CcmE